jgi:hypothetical protein
MDVLELPRPVINFLRTMSKEMHRYALCWDIFGGPESVTLTLTWKMSDGSEQTGAADSKDLATAAFSSSSNLSKNQPSIKHPNKNKELPVSGQMYPQSVKSQTAKNKQMQHSRLDNAVSGGSQKSKLLSTRNQSNLNFNMEPDYASNAEPEAALATSSKSSFIKRASNLRPAAAAHVKAAFLSARGALLPSGAKSDRNLSVDSQYSRNLLVDNVRSDYSFQQQQQQQQQQMHQMLQFEPSESNEAVDEDQDDPNEFAAAANAAFADNYNYNDIVNSQKPRHSSRKATFGQGNAKSTYSNYDSEKPIVEKSKGHNCYPSLIQSSIKTNAPSTSASSALTRQRGKSLEQCERNASGDYEYNYEYEYDKSRNNNNNNNNNEDDAGDDHDDDYGFINLDILKSSGTRSSAPSSAVASAKSNRKAQTTATAIHQSRSGGGGGGGGVTAK